MLMKRILFTIVLSLLFGFQLNAQDISKDSEFIDRGNLHYYLYYYLYYYFCVQFLHWILEIFAQKSVNFCIRSMQFFLKIRGVCKILQKNRGVYAKTCKKTGFGMQNRAEIQARYAKWGKKSGRGMQNRGTIRRDRRPRLSEPVGRNTTALSWRNP